MAKADIWPQNRITLRSVKYGKEKKKSLNKFLKTEKKGKKRGNKSKKDEADGEE